MTTPTPLSMGQSATMACLLEVIAPKPGNVHRGADFEDATFLDFAASAVAIGPVFDRADSLSVGELVLESIRATRQVVQTNTNLGLMLLMAPLAKMDLADGPQAGAAKVLASLSAKDAGDIYAAIALANPGGMGKVDDHDIAGAAPGDLLVAMGMASDRDLIARQYVSGFEDLVELPLADIRMGLKNGLRLPDAIVRAHLSLMSKRPDSLIARKCGAETANRAALMAARVLECDPTDNEDYEAALADLDFWLRSDGHRRNPGTTADMIGAALFWLLRSGEILPLR
jgi:triphosphoribosyl-dephospho-CoA synthase